MSKLPHNAEAERTILGVVFVNPATLPEIEETIGADDFGEPRHRLIFKAIQALSARSVTIDLVTVKNEMARTHDLDANGAEYLASLVDGMPRTANVKGWLRIIRDKAIQRGLIHAANLIAEFGYEGGDEAIALVDKSMSELMKVADQAHGSSGFVSPHLSAKAAMEWLDQMVMAKGGVVGLATGFKRFDQSTGGLKPGNLVIIGARPGMGKSAWAVAVGDNVAADMGKKVAYFSLEMSHEELTLRRLAKRSGVSAGMLKWIPADATENMTRVAKAYPEVANSPMFIDDTADQTVQQIRAKARRLKADRGLDLVIVDYLQLVTGERKWTANREQEVSGVSRALKQLAKELQIPVIALCQLSRRCEEREDKRPMLSDLRESGGIENDADIVGFLYRKAAYDRSADRHEAEFICRKHRNGAAFGHALVFEAELATFQDVPGEI